VEEELRSRACQDFFAERPSAARAATTRRRSETQRTRRPRRSRRRPRRSGRAHARERPVAIAWWNANQVVSSSWPRRGAVSGAARRGCHGCNRRVRSPPAARGLRDLYQPSFMFRHLCNAGVLLKNFGAYASRLVGHLTQKAARGDCRSHFSSRSEAQLRWPRPAVAEG
jgi:hypothetical protein